MATKASKNQINAEIISGWNPFTATVTRTGNFTFTVSGDHALTFPKGTRIRYKDGGSYEYGVVGAVSYSNPTTTVTLITNDDYAMAAATITDFYYSYVASPVGYPTWFNYTPTYSGFSAVPSGTERFCVLGTEITLVIWNNSAGTSNATTFSLTAPVISANVASTLWMARLAYGEDNGAGSTGLDYARIANNSSQIDVYRANASTGWTNTGSKRAGFTLIYEF